MMSRTDQKSMDEEEVDRVAEAIYDAVDQWGCLWDKTDGIKADYRAMARAAIAEIKKIGVSRS